jgi:hypothetical protein
VQLAGHRDRLATGASPGPLQVPGADETPECHELVGVLGCRAGHVPRSSFEHPALGSGQRRDLAGRQAPLRLRRLPSIYDRRVVSYVSSTNEPLAGYLSGAEDTDTLGHAADMTGLPSAGPGEAAAALASTAKGSFPIAVGTMVRYGGKHIGAGRAGKAPGGRTGCVRRLSRRPGR